MARTSNSLTVSITGAGGLPSWVPPAGRFFNVGNNTMSAVDPCPTNTCAYSGVEGQAAVFDDWNSGTYADNAGTFGTYLMWGGGHAGYGGNEVYGFDFSTLLWSRLKGPFTGVNGTWSNYDSQGMYSDGTPAVPHTYDSLQYVPGSAFGNTKGALVSTNQMILTTSGTAGTNYAHFFNLDTNTWTTSTNEGSFPGTGGFSCSAYDPIRNCIWVENETVRSSINKLDIATRTYSVVSFSSGSFVSGQDDMAGGWCVQHNVAVFWVQGFGLFVFNPATNQCVNATTSGTAAAEGASMTWCSHPSVQKFYCYTRGGSATIRTLTPPASNPMTGTWVWGSESFVSHNGATTPTTSANVTYNRLRWSDSLKCLVWAGSRTGLVTAFRPAAAS